MLNHISIQGRITKDPELRRTPDGKAVCTFSIACERDFKDKNGEKGVDFVEVVTWRHTAEFVAAYIKKGDMITASGRLQLRDWADKNGEKRRAVEVIAENVYATGNTRRSSSDDDYEAPADAFKEVTDDDLPF